MLTPNTLGFLRHKSEAFNAFKLFQKFVQSQLHITIKALK